MTEDQSIRDKGLADAIDIARDKLRVAQEARRPDTQPARQSVALLAWQVEVLIHAAEKVLDE